MIPFNQICQIGPSQPPQVSPEEFSAKLQNAPVPAWVQEMMKFYEENGYYRAEDIVRFLGDPTQPTVFISASIQFST